MTLVNMEFTLFFRGPIPLWDPADHGVLPTYSYYEPDSR
jgi:hypothetical protein